MRQKKEARRHKDEVKALQNAGCGIIFAGTITGLSSLPYFLKAKLLKQESGKGLSISAGKDGLCLALKF